MEQPDFGEDDRYVKLDDKKDPLVKLNAIIPRELFRPRLRQVWREPERKHKSPAGRKPWDEIVMFKTIILCTLYNLSDDQVEYQILGGRLLRSIGIVRAKANIGLKNLAYNMTRLAYLEGAG